MRSLVARFAELTLAPATESMYKAQPELALAKSRIGLNPRPYRGSYPGLSVVLPSAPLSAFIRPQRTSLQTSTVVSPNYSIKSLCQPNAIAPVSPGSLSGSHKSFLVQREATSSRARKYRHPYPSASSADSVASSSPKRLAKSTPSTRIRNSQCSYQDVFFKPPSRRDPQSNDNRSLRRQPPPLTEYDATVRVTHHTRREASPITRYLPRRSRNRSQDSMSSISSPRSVSTTSSDGSLILTPESCNLSMLWTQYSEDPKVSDPVDRIIFPPVAGVDHWIY